MSFLSHFNKHSWASPPYYARLWFLRDYSVYEHVTYLVVPFCVHSRVHLPMYEISSCAANPFLVVPPWSLLTFHRQQGEINYYRYTAAEVNAAAETTACRIGVLEKSGIQSCSDTNAVFKSHQVSSNSFEQTRINKVMMNLIASGGHSDTKTLEERGSRVKKNEYKSTVFLNAAHKQEHSEKSEHKAEANCSISSQLYYLSTSGLNRTKENLTNSSSSMDEEPESLCKEQQKKSIRRDAAEGDINVHVEDLPHFTDSQNDYRCSDLDDSSELDYHSTEEQDSAYHNSSYTQKTETSETFHDKELAREDRLTGVQPEFNKLEDESLSASCGIVSNYCSFSEGPELSQTFQDSNCTADHCLNSNGQEKDETVNMFYSVGDSFSANASRDKNPKSFLISKSGIDEKIKANSFSDTAGIYKISTNRGLFKKTDISNTGVSQRTGNLCQARTLVPPTHTSGGGPDISDSCSHGQSVVFNTHEICTCKLHGRCKENCPNSELNSILYLSSAANKNQSTVNQAVDATSDFRACFTTSRATNVKVPVVTKAQNTVITMMSKHRPNEWLTDSHRSVACNTDWSCMSENMETADSRRAVTDMLENLLVRDTTKHGWKPETEVPLECKNIASKDLNEIPNRLMHLSQEISDHLPNCCKEIWQRAIKAEMQLLKISYQMYHQHCWRTYKPVITEEEHVNNSAHEPEKPVSQESLPKNMEASSHSLVTQQVTEKQYPSNKNAEERENGLVENGSSDCQETTEGWFDATENLAVSDSSLSLKGHLAETQTVDDRKNVSKNIAYVHVGNLGPLVSEVDLWLNFQKYNVSEISICEYSDSHRYASLSFKSASDASLAVKEMNKKLIKGKAVKVQLVKIVRGNEVPDYQSSVKQEQENERPRSSSEKNIEHGKNCNVILKASPASASPNVVPGGPIFSSKRPHAPKDSLKSSLPAFSKTPGPISASSKVPLCASTPSSRVPAPDFKHTKPFSRNSCFEIDQEDVAENLWPLKPLQRSFVFPNALTLTSFRKVVKKLEVLHPEVSRDNILDALTEIKENKGSLSGLPLSTIVQMTSSLLNEKFPSS